MPQRVAAALPAMLTGATAAGGASTVLIVTHGGVFRECVGVLTGAGPGQPAAYVEIAELRPDGEAGWHLHESTVLPSLQGVACVSRANVDARRHD